MKDLRMRFCDGDQPDLVLDTGIHALGRLPTGLGPVAADAPWLLQVCNDRRGIWMTVADSLRGVHVNGRPVRHVALLRAGDSIHVDGSELVLIATNVERTPSSRSGAPRDPVSNLRHTLRGVGGIHHGRATSLESARTIGHARTADIRIDGPGIAELHATIEAIGDRVMLHAQGGTVLLNGQAVREALLRAGDQLAFGVQHRFVLEGPPALPTSLAGHSAQRYPEDVDAPPVPAARGWAPRVPWLLVAAILLAAALSGLLLFGAR